MWDELRDRILPRKGRVIVTCHLKSAHGDLASWECALEVSPASPSLPHSWGSVFSGAEEESKSTESSELSFNNHKALFMQPHEAGSVRGS